MSFSKISRRPLIWFSCWKTKLFFVGGATYFHKLLYGPRQCGIMCCIDMFFKLFEEECPSFLFPICTTFIRLDFPHPSQPSISRHRRNICLFAISLSLLSSSWRPQKKAMMDDVAKCKIKEERHLRLQKARVRVESNLQPPAKMSSTRFKKFRAGSCTVRTCFMFDTFGWSSARSVMPASSSNGAAPPSCLSCSYHQKIQRVGFASSVHQ